MSIELFLTSGKRVVIPGLDQDDVVQAINTFLKVDGHDSTGDAVWVAGSGDWAIDTDHIVFIRVL